MKSRNKKKIAVAVCISVIVLAAIAVGALTLTGGSLEKLSGVYYGWFDGNKSTYSLNKVDMIENSPLEGKKICFLGSSVTQGFGSLEVSFADYIAKRNNAQIVKEAVSGTTLVDNGEKSYIQRLKKIDKSADFDLLVCQLSTNDATKALPLGSVSKSSKDFDTSTVCGAIEEIITYSKETWNCPVVFYTNSYYESEEYAKMIGCLYQIAEKHGITVIDLYNDKDFNSISPEEKKLYMVDEIHPTKAGYLKWWTPKIESELYKIVG